MHGVAAAPAALGGRRARSGLLSAGHSFAASRATVAPVLVAIAVSQTWFRAGSFIAQGDIPPFVRTSMEAEYAWAWNHELTGAGSPSFQIVRAFEVLVIDAVGLLGGGQVAAQRAYYALLFGLVAFGAACFARRFTAQPAAIVVAGVFGCINPFVLTQLPNPLVLAAVGVMGISGSLVISAAQGERLRPLALAVTTVGFPYLLLNVVLVVVAVVWLLVLVGLGSALAGAGGSRRAAVLLLRALPWAVVLNLWWLVPSLATFVGDGGLEVAVSTDVRAWAWTHARSSVANVLSLNAVWSWAFPEYFPYAARLDAPGWVWLRFVPPLVCLLAPLLASGVARRRSFVVLAFALVLVLVGKGLHPPLEGLNLWMYDHVPTFWLLREPIGKIGPPLVLLYVALIAIAFSAATQRLQACFGDRPRRIGVLVIAVAGVAVLAYPYPLWNGNLFPDERPVLPSPHVRLPAEWRAAAAYLNSQPDRGKALVLPVADFYQVPTTWGYYGIDAIPKLLLRRPTIQPIPENYFGEQAGFMGLVRAVESALVSGNDRSVPGLLRSLGVSHVLLRRDIDVSFPGRTFADRSAIADSLSSRSTSPVFGPPRSFGVVDIYPVLGASSEMVQIRTGGRGGRAALGTVGAGMDFEWRRDGPARYMIDVSGARVRFLLVLTETYDRGWRLRGLPDSATVVHRRVDGYANGWMIEGAGDVRLTAEYVPARHGRLALFASTMAGALAATLTAVRGWRSGARRRTAPGSTAGRVPAVEGPE